MAAVAHQRRRWSGLTTLTALVVDPDALAVDGLQAAFGPSGIGLVVCDDGAEAVFQAGRSTPNLVIIRPSQTRLSAADVVTVIRSHMRVPIVVAVGEGETELVRPVIDAGASGLIGYPYRCTEVAGLISRHFPDAEVHRAEHAMVILGPVEMNGPAFEVRVRGQALTMPLREFQLLRYLMLHADQVVSEDQIHAVVWAARGETATTKTIALHVRRLRERLGDALELVRIRGVGYRLRAPADRGVAAP